MSKATTWHGYFQSYLDRAKKRGIDPLELLNEEWFDGETTFKNDLKPYLAPDAVVLEIACGIGRVSRFAAEHCGQLVCADILPDALVQTRRNLQHFNNVSYEQINGYDLAGFAAEQFDCVYSFTTFFHFDFELVVQYFAEIRRVLKYGGLAIIEFKKWNSELDLLELIGKIESEGGIQGYEKALDKWRYVSLDLLSTLCAYYGLEIVDEDLTHFTIRKCRQTP